MRLLQRLDDGSFRFTRRLLEDDIPQYPYAILSHTWGKDTEEVKYNDLFSGAYRGKVGYRKIQFCGEQAGKDGLQYFWVDSCCIDKSSSEELQEAINSMFRWYQRATKCYVFLSDVSTRGRSIANENMWIQDFRGSKWFTRGWTLQELLAPASVDFFSQEGDRLGDKQLLEQLVHEITKIPVSAIQGGPTSQFSVDERLSWAQHRQTTRKEDEAYSLLGIFEVSMTAIYGEGGDRAFERLLVEINKPSKEIFRLPYADDAPFDSYSRQNSPTCLENTRVDVLEEIYSWADRLTTPCIFWLIGLAGTGKSTIASTVAARYHHQKRLGASFFFARGGGDVGNASKFVTTIAVQLAINIPSVCHHISKAVTAHRDVAVRSLREQWKTLVLDPLSKLGSTSHSYILVIDALDECDDKDSVRTILNLLTEAGTLKTRQMRIFLTSRPEIPNQHRFTDVQRQDFILHDVLPSTVDHDIATFLMHSLKLIGQEKNQESDWPGVEAIQTLTKSASGLFIWAATACRFIRGGLFADERLDMLLDGNIAYEDHEHPSPEVHLNQMYFTILRNSLKPSFSQKDKERFNIMAKEVLGSIAGLASPLSMNSLSKLLSIPLTRLESILENLQAILNVPADRTLPIRLHHPSFRDFLFDKDRSDAFWVDQAQANRTLAARCIKLMDSSLRQNICDVESPGTLAASVVTSRLEHCLPPELQYACLHWVQHVQNDGVQLGDSQAYQFMKVRFLHWLETMGWMQKIPEAVLSLSVLESIALMAHNAHVHPFFYDMKRFSLYSQSAIERAPLQIYSSALTFAPTKSLVKKQFEGSASKWTQVLSPIVEHWTATLQTLEGHRGEVYSIAFSPNGKQLASGAEDTTVYIWDPKSGAMLQLLKGHSSSVHFVQFSLDSKKLWSASSGGRVILWDIESETELWRLEFDVECNAISPDDKQLAFGLSDGTIKLLNIESGISQTFSGHSGYVGSIIFSPDGKQMVFDSIDKTVRFCDVESGTVQQIFESSDSIYEIALSPDGKWLAIASDDMHLLPWPPGNVLIKQRDARSASVLQTLKGHSSTIVCVSFSPKSNQLASASSDGTINLWDTQSGKLLQSLEGFSDVVISLKFSFDGTQLASCSSDGIVRLWDTQWISTLEPCNGQSADILSIALSEDGNRLASGSSEGKIGLWASESGKLLQTLESHSDWVESVAFLPDGNRLVSSSGEGKIELWDYESGKLLQTLESNSDWPKSVAFSLDGNRLVSGSREGTIELWDSESGKLLQTLGTHSEDVDSVAFSLDGNRLASGSISGTIKLWNAESGELLQKLKGHCDWIRSIAFSPDGDRLASSSRDGTIRIWSTTSGETLQTLEVEPMVFQLSFSLDGLHLICEQGTIRLGSPFEPTIPMKLERRSLSVSDEWVMLGLQRLLWVPPDYRGGCFMAKGPKLFLGCRSGSVLILNFDLAQIEKIQR